MIDLSIPEIEFAIQAVRQASILVHQIQKELAANALTKDDRSPVTVADFTSQALVGYLLSNTFPSEKMVAEEDSTALQRDGASQILAQVIKFARRFTLQATSQAVCDWIDHGRVDTASRFWTLDPIDGTKGFLRGDQFAVALALVVEGQVQVAALGCPGLTDAADPDMSGSGSLVIAARGQGSWTTQLEGAKGGFKQLGVSSQQCPSQARLLRSFESGHTNVNQIDIFADNLGIQADPVRMDSQAKYAVLAAGKGDLLLRLISPAKPDYKEKIWDQAAGSLVLEEAGGCITDLDGNALDFATGRKLINNRGVLASNGLLHDQALQALRDIGA